MPSETATPDSATVLGSLQAIDLRHVWPDEAVDFTPWLARPENMSRLGATLGMQLGTERVEAAVGGFSADILARNASDNTLVVIENQLEQTDHAHLGQVLTYMAGLDAKTVVWIAKRIRDEHRAAVEWLNTNTGEDFRFFAVEVELWRIGESLPAPRFSLVVKPNNWVKAERAQQVQSSAASLEYFAFWTALQEWMQGHQSTVSIDRPTRNANVWIPVSGTPFVLSLFCAKKSVGLFVRPAAVKTEAAGQEALALLKSIHSALVAKLSLTGEAAISSDLQLALPRKPDDKDQLPSLFEWLTGQAERYASAVREAVEQAER